MQDSTVGAVLVLPLFLNCDDAEADYEKVRVASSDHLAIIWPPIQRFSPVNSGGLVQQVLNRYRPHPIIEIGNAAAIAKNQ